MSALKPKTQESVLHLIDLGYKPTNERIIRMKNAEGKGEKLDEMELRKILDDKDLKPKQSEPVQQPEAPAPTPGAAPEPPGAAVSQPPIPASPDVPHTPDVPPLRILPRGRSRREALPRSRGPDSPPPALPRRKRTMTR